jgi:hypothetical protein
MDSHYRQIPCADDRYRINRIWKMIKALFGDIDAAEVAAAMNAQGIPISTNRVTAWSRGERSDKFSPMNAAELEAALSALLKKMDSDPQ